MRRPTTAPAAAARRGDGLAARRGADALPQLRAVGHHVARAAGRARRAEAGPAPHPVHDVAAEPDGRRQASQVRQGRRRRDGQLPSARRRRAVRNARPHGAAVLAALSAGGRLGQLRIARRRQRGGDALHRVPARAHQRRDPDRDRSGHGRVPAELRRHARGAGRAAGAHSESARERRHRHRRRHGDEHSAAQPQGSLRGADRDDRRRHGALERPARQAHQGPGFSDRRPDHEHAAGDPRDLQDRQRHDSHPRELAGRPVLAQRQDDLHHERAVRREQGARSSSASPTSRSRASCRIWSTSRTCRQTTCGLRWS